MAEFRFPSLQNPNMRYVVSTERLVEDWRDAHRYLSDYIGQFDTMGDGETAHTPTGRVLYEQFTDFCASAATHFHNCQHTADELDEMARTLSGEMRSYNGGADDMRSAANVKYKDGKTRYYEKNTFKVSSSDSKRHDKRWEEVCQYHDGSFASIVGLCGVGSHGGFLSRYAAIEQASDTYQTIFGGYDSSRDPGRFMEWMNWEYERCHRAREAFHALKYFCRSVTERDQAVRSLECYVHNVENDKRLKEEAVA